MTWLYVTTFGIIGVSLRFLIDYLTINLKASFPWQTLIINLIGCFMAGIVFKHSGLHPSLKTGLLVGLCGGLTTFSALSLQTYALLDSGEVVSAIGYVLASQVLGLLAIYFGVFFGKMVF